ncbi:MAG TPA: alkaline phosphatase family protein [Blastocatellia bacterium]|jgi:YVTN family beta-propeller protein|nr:alkaline phosphatase family protein [Blastocatellia bacterium]
MKKLTLLFVLTLLFPIPSSSQTNDKPVRAVTDPGVVTTRQTITPAGAQTIFDGRVYGVAFGAAPNEIWALTARGRSAPTQVFKLDWENNKILSRLPLAENPGLQGIIFDHVANQPLISGTLTGAAAKDPKGKTRLLTVGDEASKIITDELGNFIAGAIAVARQANARGERLVVAPLIYNNQLAVVDVNTGKLAGRIDTGIAPFGAVINAAGTTAYVSNWGGRLPKPGDLTAPTGYDPKADQVVVDERGIASTGTVTRIDLATMKSVSAIQVELHPTAMAWDEQGNRLYVANSNKDSISVIDTTADKVIRTQTLSGQDTRGFAPTALALTADGKTLFAACGGLNAVAVIKTKDMAVAGYIPTAWYPNALSLSPDGKSLAIGALLGAGSSWREEPRKRFVHSYRGSVAVVPVPDEAQLASYTTAVWENNHLAKVAPLAPVKNIAKPAPAAVPARAGDPSLIEHVVYVIKENRTYDQVFGDVSKGNGDPSLVMFGEDVTPNQHRLADQFVLLDNFYATGGNSGDGHQWVTQANETSYALWPGYAGRSYPFDGSDPIAYSDSGFIWDAALKMKKTVRVYGEYAGRMNEVDRQQRVKLFDRWKAGEDLTREWNITAPIKPLNSILARNFPAYSTAIPDVVRAQIFIADVKKWEIEGKMPNLVLLQLPSNHTNGAAPGAHTPKAMVADNDLALGQIVEVLSKTPFWKKMAIFVVEDDAQNGVDHVDGHRTTALAISPYIRRGSVDSTFYAHQSMLKTIELILGLPTLSLFDLIAYDMRASFTNEPDFTPYTAARPKQSLFELNPQLGSLRGQLRRDALDSMRMRFNTPDAAPTERLNRIVWRQVKGVKSPYPRARRATFSALSVDIDDDDRER